MDLYSHILPIYQVNPLEKITDAYLDQYIWYESSKRGLFPNWIKPADTEPLPLLVYKFCLGINNLKDVWNTENNEFLVLMKSKYEDMFAKVDLTLLNRLLRLVMDQNLADYLVSRNNVSISFKDMNHTNSYGILHGFQFSSYLIQFWGLALDLIHLGIPRSMDLQGSQEMPNDFMEFSNEEVEGRHPLKAYCRYID